MTTRRVTFNLNNFLEELHPCFYMDRPDLIDDTVQKYKDFLLNTNKRIREVSKKHVENHVLYTDNKQVKSYIDACHRLNFDK